MDSADYIRETLHQFIEMLSSSTVDSKEKMQDIRTVLRLLKYRIYAEHPKLLNMMPSPDPHQRFYRWSDSWSE